MFNKQSDLRMMRTNRMIIAVVIMFLMIFTSTAMTQATADINTKDTTAIKQSHKFSPSVSNQLSEAIKIKIISNLSSFSDQKFAQLLKEDLNQENDKERKLKQISPKSAEELFKIFNLKGIVCDKNGDGVIIKEELQCLNYIWKYYVPEDPPSESQ